MVKLSKASFKTSGFVFSVNWIFKKIFREYRVSNSLDLTLNVQISAADIYLSKLDFLFYILGHFIS